MREGQTTAVKTARANGWLRVKTVKLLAAIAVGTGLLVASGGGHCAAQSSQAAATVETVRGVVRDGSGNPVSGATVRLERKGATEGAATTSSSSGEFQFSPAVAGEYRVRATSGAFASEDVSLVVGSRSGAPARPLVLILKEGGASGGLAAQAMEFSDTPSFTIAAVTDWTAAGGHGSDTILRTSEALTRDTVRLQGTETAIADPALKEATSLEARGDVKSARRAVGELLAKEETGERLRVAGELDEKLGDPIAAVQEFEKAVRRDGSEENYFAWGSELLRHRAIWQAKDVFQAGAHKYPQSARMTTALGAALFACALYEDAAKTLCRAATLNPDADEAYLFLGKVTIASPDPLACAEDKLSNFVKRRPQNPLASYYDAMAIWKQSGRSSDPQVLARVEELLNQAVALDSRCADAYLQLGNLNVARRDSAGAIADYSKAIEADPQLAEAHYRLGLAYDRVGEKEKANREFAIHEELDKQQAAEIERQRREVKQFLVKGSSADAVHP
ncbi:tetratricopeptide repeat protein [Acidobacteria bacterium AB60]|nr:tetratricopeptide repeat protein [Acidobacteria bacterium AB60]